MGQGLCSGSFSLALLAVSGSNHALLICVSIPSLSMQSCVGQQLQIRVKVHLMCLQVGCTEFCGCEDPSSPHQTRACSDTQLLSVQEPSYNDCRNKLNWTETREEHVCFSSASLFVLQLSASFYCSIMFAVSCTGDTLKVQHERTGQLLLFHSHNK